MAKKFFYVCAGLCLLALSYHLGAGNATAQAPGNPFVSVTSMESDGSIQLAITANGDEYEHSGIGGTAPWTFEGNIFGAATPAQSTTWGQVKSAYRK